MKHTILLFLTASVALAATSSALASGSYVNRSPNPPRTKAMELDQEKYGLGQKIFTGRVKPSAQTDATAQMEKLKMLQAMLPPSAAKSTDLTHLAGKLTAQQLEALDYFVKQRYGSKK